MRRLAGLVGGALLALVLFYLLALLVAPPEPEETQVIEPTSMAMVDAVPQEQPVPTQSAAPAPTPPSQPPPPPAAAVQPVAQSPSPVEIPEPETPPVETPDVTLDDTLPSLDEVEPEPEPEPEPQPEPEPEPQPAPEPEPAPQPAPSSSAQSASAAAPSESASPAAPAQPPRGTQASPRDVGELSPTRKVNPEYPRRAQRRGLEGYVEVRFTIQPDGSVDTGTLQVIDSNPPRVFDREVQRAMAQWRFPQADDFRRVTQRIEFQLGGR